MVTLNDSKGREAAVRALAKANHERGECENWAPGYSTLGPAPAYARIFDAEGDTAHHVKDAERTIAALEASGWYLATEPAVSGLDVAWASVEAALPDGWRFFSLEQADKGGEWEASADHPRPDLGDHRWDFREGHGATPVQALHNLAVVLAETTAPVESKGAGE